MATRRQSKQEVEEVANQATLILAYLDMENEEMVGTLLHGTDHRTLGLIISTWYQMCIAARTATVAARTARQAMEFFWEAAGSSDISHEDKEAALYTRRILHRLSEADTSGYAEMWQLAVDQGNDLTTAVAARMLGFTKGMLEENPGPDCE